MIAAALCALPLFSQTATSKFQTLLRFTLDEAPAKIVELLGRPGRIDWVQGYISWQYESVENDDHDDNYPPSLIVCLSAENRQILSLTRNFVTAQDVEELFPRAETSVYHWPSATNSQFSVRLRRLPGERLLLATGTGNAGELTQQLILIRRSALKMFMPWLAEQLR